MGVGSGKNGERKTAGRRLWERGGSGGEAIGSEPACSARTAPR